MATVIFIYLCICLMIYLFIVSRIVFGFILMCLLLGSLVDVSRVMWCSHCFCAYIVLEEDIQMFWFGFVKSSNVYFCFDI